MCIIIDTCCFASVFDAKTIDHEHYQPVLKWVTDGKGKIIYGGTKYKEELAKAGKYLQLIVELRKAGKVIELELEKVDLVQYDVKSKETDLDFDDPHLIAIVIVSRCKIVCTHDRRSHKFLKKKSLYPKSTYRPLIYSNKTHQSLLCDKHILGVCC
jgi:predicted nucleic acid-binding protein